MSTEFRRASVDKEIDKLYKIIESAHRELKSHYLKEAYEYKEPTEEQERFISDMEHYITEFEDNSVVDYLNSAINEMLSQVRHGGTMPDLNIKIHSREQLYAQHADELCYGRAELIRTISDSYIEGLKKLFEMNFIQWRDGLLSGKED